jgi:hypothetical protein
MDIKIITCNCERCFNINIYRMKIVKYKIAEEFFGNINTDYLESIKKKGEQSKCWLKVYEHNKCEIQ